MSKYRIPVADLVANQPDSLRVSAQEALDESAGKPGYAGRLADVIFRQALLTAVVPGALPDDDVSADLGTTYDEILALIDAITHIEGICSKLLDIVAEGTGDNPAAQVIVQISRFALEGPPSSLVPSEDSGTGASLPTEQEIFASIFGDLPPTV